MNTKTQVIAAFLLVVTNSYGSAVELPACPNLTGKYTVADQEWLLIRNRQLTITQANTGGVTTYLFTYEEESELPETVTFTSDSKLVNVSDAFSVTASCAAGALIVDENYLQNSTVIDSNQSKFELVGQNLVQRITTKAAVELQTWTKIE